MVVYEDDQNGIIEESFNGTYSIEPGFITMEPMPTGWGNPSGFFHYVTDFGNGKMSWYFPEKDGRVQWEKVKKQTTDISNNLTRTRHGEVFSK